MNIELHHNEHVNLFVYIILESLGLVIHMPSRPCAKIKKLYIMLVFHEHKRHIEPDCKFVLEKIEQGLVSIKHDTTRDLLADLFTKALPRSWVIYISKKVGTMDICTPT